LGVKFLGIEKRRQAIVFVERQLALVEDPFAVAQNAVDAPVNEQAELGVLEFAAGLQVFWGGLVVGLGGGVYHENTNGRKGNSERESCNRELPGFCHVRFSAP